jgi:transcriptional regulator with XRE-family HTH domain
LRYCVDWGKLSRVFVVLGLFNKVTALDNRFSETKMRRSVHAPKLKPRARKASRAQSLPQLLLGRKIKLARTSKGMRLRELAEHTDLSQGLLSKLENDKAIPSLTSLHRIAAALDTNVSWFFSGDACHGQIVIRKGERPTIRSKSELATIENIVPHGNGHLLQALILTIEPGGSSEGAREHIGEEAGYIIAGDFELILDGTSYRLSAGDSFNFRSERPHAYRNPGKRQTKLIWVNTPPTL